MATIRATEFVGAAVITLIHERSSGYRAWIAPEGQPTKSAHEGASVTEPHSRAINPTVELCNCTTTEVAKLPASLIVTIKISPDYPDVSAPVVDC